MGEVGRNVGTEGQYSLLKILGIWVLAAAPMALLAWVVTPALAPRVDMHPGIFLWVLMIVGLLWQVVLSFALLYSEEGTLNLAAIRYRTWRQQPREIEGSEYTDFYKHLTMDVGEPLLVSEALLIRALKRHDKVHETLVKRHEGHGFYREQNQVELYGRIERFLRTHMPAGPESGTRAPASP